MIVDTCTDLSRPVEIHQIHLRPADFFTCNPALDVPGVKNATSVLASEEDSCCAKGDVQQAASSHVQGSGPDYKPKSKL
jgi:primary-amine oxidase